MSIPTSQPRNFQEDINCTLAQKDLLFTAEYKNNQVLVLKDLKKNSEFLKNNLKKEKNAPGVLNLSNQCLY